MIPLRQQLMTVKGKLDKHDVKGIVYSIPCECGSLYIGETGRTLKTRLMEHKWSVCNRDTNNGITVHVIEIDHSVQWEQAAVIKTEEFITKWKVQEALTIRTTDNNMNLDLGLMLERIWFWLFSYYVISLHLPSLQCPLVIFLLPVLLAHMLLVIISV